MSLALISQSYLSDSDLDSELGGPKVEAGLSDIIGNANEEVYEDGMPGRNHDTKIDRLPLHMSMSAPRSKRSRPTLFRERNGLSRKPLQTVKHELVDQKVEGVDGIGSENKFYKCPFCLLVCSTGSELIQHLGIHLEYRDKAKVKAITRDTIRINKGKRGSQNQSVSNLLNNDSETRMHCHNGGTNEALQNTPSRGEPVEMGNLTDWTEIKPFQIRPCNVVLTRCDNMLTTGTVPASFPHGCMDSRRELQKGVETQRKCVKSQSLKMKGDSDKSSPDKKIKPSNSKFPRKKFPRNKTKKSHRCPACSKTFRNSEQANIHLRIHTKDMHYQCPTCSKAFSQSGSLRKHLRIHTGEKPFPCKTCSRTFANYSNMQKHMSIHTGVWRYRCTVCSKGFQQKSKLEFHMYTHTGETPFRCPNCSQGFRQPSALSRHIRTIHKD